MEISYRIPKIRLEIRLILLAAFQAAGISIQLYSLSEKSAGHPFFGVLLGTLVMIGGLVFISSRPYTNRPKDLGYENWKPVKIAQIDRIADNLKQTAAMKVPLLFKGTTGIIMLFLAFLLFMFSLATERYVIPVFFLDSYIVLLPYFAFARIKLFTPKDISLKIRVYQTLLSQKRPDGAVFSPYIRFDKDKENREIPEDIRLMLELKKKPDDFIGVQFQTAINRGPRGDVPYLYAVFLCRGKGGTYSNLSKVDYSMKFIAEAGGDDEYGTIVVRQQTSGVGYHTDSGDIISLYSLVLDTLRMVI